MHITFEEGTYSAWLYGLLIGRVARVVVCNPRKNPMLKVGNKNDQHDALKLSEALRGGLLSAVYHGDNGLATVRELGRSYTTLTADTTRVMGRLKAVFRGRAIATAGKKLYHPRHRGEWLAQLGEPGLRRRTELFYRQLDALQALRHQARQELIAHCLDASAATERMRNQYRGDLQVPLDDHNALAHSDRASSQGGWLQRILLGCRRGGVFS